MPPPPGTPEDPAAASRAGADPTVLVTEPRTAVAGRRRRLTGLAVDVGPLRRSRDFRLLWLGQSTSLLGSMITFVAVPYQVHAITGSTLAVGLLGLVEFVAMLSTAFLGGALADAVDRRRMVLSTDAALLVCSAVLCANALLPEPRVAVLFLVATAMTALESLQRPSLDALLPRLVPRSDLMAAGALRSLQMNVGQIGGPAVGGVLIATVGLPATYAVDVASFVLSLAVLSRMRAVPPPPGADRPSVRGVLEGLRYARSRPELMGTYLVDVNAMLFGMPNALFPALAAGYGGPAVLGLLYTAPAVGSLVASLTSGWTARVAKHGQAVLWAAGVWGVGILGFGLSTGLWPALACLAVAGAADTVSGLFRMTIWNSTIPDHLRGRLAGIELISYSSGPSLGNVRAGAVAALGGPRLSAASGGLLCVLGTVALAAALPAFRRYDARELPPVTQG